MAKFPRLKPEFDFKEAKIALGYPRYYAVEEPVKSLLELAYERAKELVKKEGIYKIYSCEVTEDQVKLFDKNDHVFNSKKLAGALSGCYEAVLFLVTIGGAVEDEAAELFSRGEFTRGLVMDAIGSAFVEGLAESAQNYFKEKGKKEGFEVTRRYSPGYGDFDLQYQKLIFKLLEPSEIGVYLTEGNMMVPKKSISAIFGKKLVE